MRIHLGTPPSRSARHLRRACAVGGVGALVVGGLTGLGPTASEASSHREAPLIAGDPRADNTDVYAFVSPDDPDTVTLIANWIPFEEPNGGPNFYPFATDARYKIKVDNDGDARPDVSYTWEFTDHVRDPGGHFLYNTGPVSSVEDETLNFYQSYDLTVAREGEGRELVLDDAIAAPSNVGPASMPDYEALYEEAITPLDGGGQTFVGQSDDPFFLDLRVFDLLYGGDLSETGEDTLAGYNVNAIALQVPKDDLAVSGDAAANPVIGVWSTTERKGASVSAAPGAATKGDWVQVSRLGNPLVNEVVVPLKFKDAFNGLTPDKDATVTPVVRKVLRPILPNLIEAVYGIEAPDTPRNDLFEIFLTGLCEECAGPNGEVAIPIDLNSQRLNDGAADTFVPSEQLRLNMSIAPAGDPDRLGVLAGDTQGFPNGRRLTDDVIDISVQAVEGAAQSGELVAALADGDGVDANDQPFRSTFPYLALPHGSSVNGGSPVAPMSFGFAGALLAGAAFLSIRRNRLDEA